MSQVQQTNPSQFNQIGAYLRRIPASFAVPAYRWLWASTFFGSMRLIAIFVTRGWLVLEMTNSPFWVGAAVALRGLIQILFGGFIGVLLDRLNRRRMLFLAEIGTSLVALIIGGLILSEQIALWHILLASLLEGVFVSIRWPALNTIVYEIVGSDRILNASAAQLLSFNVGNILASAFTGYLIATYGIAIGYFLGAACGLIGTFLLLGVRGSFMSTTPSEPFMDALLGGLHYIWTRPAIQYLVGFSFIAALLGWSHISMMPVMARDVLGLDADGLGFLTSAGGIGALLSTLLIASLGDYKDKAGLLIVCASLTSFGLLTFAFSPWFYLSLALVAILHGGLMALETALLAMVLLLTSDDMQGRVQGIYSLVFGFTWLGGVLLGTLASILGVSIALAFGGTVIAIVTAILRKPIKTLSQEDSK